MATRKPSLPVLNPEIVDEIGDLEAELKPLTPKISRLEALRKEARQAYAGDTPESTFAALGERYILQVGPNAMQDRVNLVRLAKTLTYNAFAKLANVTLASLRAGAPTIADACTVTTQTGPRSLKILEKGTAS